VYEEHARVVPAGTPLLQVGDPRSLEAVVPVLTTDAARIRAGQRVRVWTGVDTLDGTVLRVEPAAYTKVSALGVEEQRVPVIVKVDGAVRSAVGDAFRVQARIIVSAVAGVLLVPSSALARHGDTWEVFVVSRGVARRRTVEVGERGGNLMWVRTGLAAGDTVVAFPDENIKDGVRVRSVTR
jgi:HlyD family secretion protein